MSNNYGYTRISTRHQESNTSLQEQKKELLKHNIPAKNIYSEIYTGTSMDDRKVFQFLLDKMQPGDTLWATKVDRLSRNLFDYITLLKNLKDRNIKVKTLDLPLSTDENTYDLFQAMLILFADWEHKRRKSRQDAGMEALRESPELWKEKFKGKQTFIPELAVLVKHYKEKNPNLRVDELRTLIGKEFYGKRKARIRPIAQATYYKTLRWLRSPETTPLTKKEKEALKEKEKMLEQEAGVTVESSSSGQPGKTGPVTFWKKKLLQRKK